MFMETERLILRPVTMSDDRDMFEYSSDPDVGPNAGWPPHKNIKETRALIRDLYIPQHGFFGIELKENHKLIGAAGLCGDPKREYDRTKMLGFALNSKFQKKGYMTESCKRIVRFGFENLDLALISCYCYPYNIRSAGVIKRLGFSYEGRLSLCERRFDGKVFDNDCYCLTREEFNRINRLMF